MVGDKHEEELGRWKGHWMSPSFIVVTFTAQTVKAETVVCNAFDVSPIRLESAQRVWNFTELLINCNITGAYKDRPI